MKLGFDPTFLVALLIVVAAVVGGWFVLIDALKYLGAIP